MPRKKVCKNPSCGEAFSGNQCPNCKAVFVNSKFVPPKGSQSKYKYSIIQTEQNTTKCNKIQQDKIQKFQNTNTTKYKRTKYKLPKYKCNKMQMHQNTNGTKYK